MPLTEILAEAVEVPLPSSDDDSDEDVLLEDADTCTPLELEQAFQHKYNINNEMALSLKKLYILKLCKDDSLTHLAAGLSDTSVDLLDVSSERGLSRLLNIPPLNGDKKRLKICGVRFLDETANHLLVGTTNGLVRLFDLRTATEQARFEDNLVNGQSTSVPISSFDRNANSRLLCTGSDQFQKDVFLIFYDLRQRKYMGSYFESHEDDVTALRFHPQNPDTLASGSLDGLINIFDLRKTKEEDALLTTINTEDSIQKINWHKNVYNKDIISCITHTDFRTYESDEGDLVAEFERDKVAKALKREKSANCNLIDAHSTVDNDIILLAGTNLRKGEILRSLRMQNKQLLPYANYDGNRQIVRESVYDANKDVLITAGEGAMVTLWSPQSNTVSLGSNPLKAKTTKSNKAKPY